MQAFPQGFSCKKYGAQIADEKNRPAGSLPICRAVCISRRGRKAGMPASCPMGETRLLLFVAFVVFFRRFGKVGGILHFGGGGFGGDIALFARST